MLYFAVIVLLCACADKPQAEKEKTKTQKLYVGNRMPLLQTPLIKLPTGSIKAEGWLKKQLDLQIQGLTGNLDKIWDDVGPNSSWLGGTGESWERGPYYLRGAVALAYTTRDTLMLNKIRPWIEWTLSSQQASGFFGPASNKDWWPRMLMLQTLQMHYEATGDKRVIPFMQKFFAYQAQNLDNQPLKGWASARGGENLLNIHWLYNHTGDRSLLHLAQKINSQTVDWTRLFNGNTPIHTSAGVDTTKWWEESPQHTVNLSHGIKQPALLFQQTGDRHYYDATYNALALTDRFHQQIYGVHTGDERVGYATATRGSELCEIVEYMHSMEQVMRIFADPAMADRLEKVAYNALPAAISPDWKAHCYYIAPNVANISRGKRNFTVDHGDDLTFGVLAGYPCCAVDMHMGWPMLTENLWMATSAKGLSAMVYAPSLVQAKVAKGVSVTIREETDYPFGENILFHIEPEKEVAFPLQLRIPLWCKRPVIRINSDTFPQVEAGNFAILERTWKKGDKVELTLPMDVQLSRWEGNSTGIERGPLVYALAIDEKWQAQPDWRRGNIEDDFPAYEILPGSAWNYGLVVDSTQPDKSFSITSSSPIPLQPWSQKSVPVYITAKGKKIPEWKLNDINNPAPIPQSPVASTEKEESIKLIPFGATRLRITYLPLVE
jgi:hypothetical protein